MARLLEQVILHRWRDFRKAANRTGGNLLISAWNSNDQRSTFARQFNFQTVSLAEKVRSVEAVFEELDRAVAAFQSWSELRCQWGCGKCCFKPDIEATVLEFLPFAHDLHERGLAYDWLERIKSTNGEICLILNPSRDGAGLCTSYQTRGLICRLFGFSARTNKYGAKELVTCSTIKSGQAGAFSTAAQKVTDGAPIPVMSDYYMKLVAIDRELARDFYPVNQAIRRAIETVLHYYAYRN